LGLFPASIYYICLFLWPASAYSEPSLLVCAATVQVRGQGRYGHSTGSTNTYKFLLEMDLAPNLWRSCALGVVVDHTMPIDRNLEKWSNSYREASHLTGRGTSLYCCLDPDPVSDRLRLLHATKPGEICQIVRTMGFVNHGDGTTSSFGRGMSMNLLKLASLD